MERRPCALTPLAVAGIGGPCLFTALVLVQAAMQPDYSAIEMPISALAAWPAGWIQNLNFYLFGTLTVAFAIGLHLGLRQMPKGLAGPGILGMSGVGIVLAGVFPMRRGADGTVVEPIGHVLAAIMTFFGVAVAFIVVSRRMRRDPEWTGLAGATRAVGGALLLMFVAMAALAAPPHAPLHRWFGLLQRAILFVWFPWQIALAVTLLRRERRTPSADPRLL